MMSETELKSKIGSIHSVSSCFCLAKWLQVTIDLVHGTTHSCHHPKRHDIPLSELAENPGALHNTAFKKKQRQMMLNGVRPPECGYCWEVEDAGSAYSDRIIKSTDPWAFPHLERISSLSWDADVKPTYVEIMLDDLCNFSCMYCLADISTGVAAEMKRHGPYPVKASDHRMPAPAKGHESASRDENPFLAAFWKWFPEILPDLEVFRITGGEPLLSPHLPKILDFIGAQANQKLTLVLNSHLCHGDSRAIPVMNKVQALLSETRIGKFELYTSLDAHGRCAEYIRHGLDYALFMQNLEKTARTFPASKLTIMCTFNILSIGSFERFLEDLRPLRQSLPNIGIDISHLRNPPYLRANLATPDLSEKLMSVLRRVQKDASFAFSPHEVAKLQNVVEWVFQKQEDGIIRSNRADLFRFINEYDRRKKRRFLEIFPDYRDFYISCKRAAFELADRGKSPSENSLASE